MLSELFCLCWLTRLVLTCSYTLQLIDTASLQVCRIHIFLFSSFMNQSKHCDDVSEGLSLSELIYSVCRKYDSGFCCRTNP